MFADQVLPEVFCIASSNVSDLLFLAKEIDKIPLDPLKVDARTFLDVLTPFDVGIEERAERLACPGSDEADRSQLLIHDTVDLL
ncbi:MAG: hypothetical protein ACE37H_08090 [Phycisphaeraceae bacterium]